MIDFRTKKRVGKESRIDRPLCQFCKGRENLYLIGGYETCSNCLSTRFDICVRCQGYAPGEEMKHIQVDGTRRAVCPCCREQLESRGCTLCRGRMDWQNAFISATCESCGGMGYQEYLRMQEEAERSANEDYEIRSLAHFRDWLFWADE
jgi:hypothetical protein